MPAPASSTPSESDPAVPAARVAPPLPVLLALDTATDRIHAALVTGAVERTLDLPGGALASATLLPALQGLLQQAGLVWADVGAIAFGCGPGAFTGLRTACSVTQGLALGLGCPVIAIDTLMAVAEDARLAAPQAWSAGDEMWVLQDARMEELYVSAFEWTGQAWQTTHAAQLWALDEPARRWADTSTSSPNPADSVASSQGAGQAEGCSPLPCSAGVRWAGNAATAYPAHLAALLAAEQTVPEQAAPEQAVSASHSPAAPAAAPAMTSPTRRSAAPRGAALASLAWAAWLRGETLDAALALPRYVRDKVAQTTAERAAVQAARDSAAPSAPAVRA